MTISVQREFSVVASIFEKHICTYVVEQNSKHFTTYITQISPLMFKIIAFS